MADKIDVGEDKVWITASRTVNVGDYESYKIEMGLSQTIGARQDPMDLLEKAETNLRELIMEKAEEVKAELKRQKRIKRKRYD